MAGPVSNVDALANPESLEMYREYTGTAGLTGAKT